MRGNSRNRKVAQRIECPTLSTLEKLKGREFVSKQYIEELTNSKYLQQVERDIVSEALKSEGKTVNVRKFSLKVRSELLPLTVVSSKNGEPFYGYIALPENIRGPVADYSEHVYESPIKTSAGSIHFGTTVLSGNDEPPQKYFGHTRIEDMAVVAKQRDVDIYGLPIYDFPSQAEYTGGTRRIIELQSDLYQKGRLEFEDHILESSNAYKEFTAGKITSEEYKYIVNNTTRQKELDKLHQYNNPTAHYRMLREEIRYAAKDGKTKLQFPTGQTIMGIEGLGSTELWDKILHRGRDGEPDETVPLESDELTKDAIGMGISNSHGSEWIITDVLGDGKFSAIPKEFYHKHGIQKGSPTFDSHKETFDISGKLDISNPIYKFYEHDIGRYLKNKYGAEIIKDAQGITWHEIKVKPEMATQPVLAFDGDVQYDRTRKNIQQKTKDMEKEKAKEKNKRLEDFNKVLSRLTVKAPMPEKEKTGIRRSLEDFSKSLREIQNSREDHAINLGEDHEQNIEL